MIKTCPRCGTRFECLQSPDCWCAKIILDEKTRLDLAAHDADCLCPVCLEKIAAHATIESPKS